MNSLAFCSVHSFLRAYNYDDIFAFQNISKKLLQMFIFGQNNSPHSDFLYNSISILFICHVISKIFGNENSFEVVIFKF